MRFYISFGQQVACWALRFFSAMGNVRVCGRGRKFTSTAFAQEFSLEDALCALLKTDENCTHGLSSPRLCEKACDADGSWSR